MNIYEVRRRAAARAIGYTAAALGATLALAAALVWWLRR